MLSSIGITTFHNLYNMGSALQAFALQRTIETLGCTCRIVDYRRSNVGTSYQLFHASCRPNDLVHNALAISTLWSQIGLRRRFKAFRDRHMVLTEQAFWSLDELENGESAFEGYVTGSDIVWQPAWLEKEYGAVYYLEFVRKARRIAYAPSFGVTEIPSKYQDRIAGNLRRFDFLSAREEAGCRIIRELTGREVPHVLDPTLLLSAEVYDSVATHPPLAEGSYILMYPMQWSPDLCRIAQVVRRRLRLPLVAIVPIYRNPWRFSFADKVVFDAGPSEFVGWMKNAAFVCTNSFHGTAFSIIYRKQFLSSPAATMNSRIVSLLDRLGLRARQFRDVHDAEKTQDVLEPLDYGPSEAALTDAVGLSMDYLRRGLA